MKRFTQTTKWLASSLTLFVVMAVSVNAAAQTYNLQSYQMKISGSSNVHDWTMKAQNAKCNANFVLNGANVADLSALEFSMPVKGLKSEHDLMDERAYTTLKNEKAPNISFKLTSGEVAPQGGNKYLIKATGNLTIGGVTRGIVITTNGVLNSDKSISVTGKQKIKMSEFGIKPPTFMLGAMKVGDEVTVDFNMKFNG